MVAFNQIRRWKPQIKEHGYYGVFVVVEIVSRIDCKIRYLDNHALKIHETDFVDGYSEILN